MITGLMFALERGETYERAIPKAVLRFEERFGRRPTKCYLPKGMDCISQTGVLLQNADFISPRHFMLVVEVGDDVHSQ